MSLMIKCILYPGAHLFVVSGGKAQAAGIIAEKVREICNLIPAFDKEIDYAPKTSSFTNDYVKVQFKNGSYFDNLAANEKTRGKRRQGGTMEECVSIDGTILSEVIIPVMNVSRRALDGTVHPEEPLNKSQLYITTAGYRNTFAYDKHIQILIWSIVNPDRAMVLGGTWRIPVLMKLLDKDFVKDLQQDGTFNESSFEREYESKWSGSVDNSFFRAELFDRNRSIQLPEKEASKRLGNAGYYVIGVDVGRKGCATVATILKCMPQPDGADMKHLVNMVILEDEHFETQAIKLKQLFYLYKARRLVIDGNGLGIGLLDYMVKAQTIPDTGEFYPDFGILNDEENFYKKYESSACVKDAIYIIKANAVINTEAHSTLQSQMSSGKIKFLIDERTAKNKLLSTKMGQEMTSEQRAEYLKPYTLTSILREEIMNLREETEGINILLKRVNKNIEKDKFSSLEYAVLYVHTNEESGRRRKKRFNIKDFMFMN